MICLWCLASSLAVSSRVVNENVAHINTRCVVCKQVKQSQATPTGAYTILARIPPVSHSLRHDFFFQMELSLIKTNLDLPEGNKNQCL